MTKHSQAGSNSAPPRPAAPALGDLGSSRSPLYHQIFLILRGRILAGEYRLGDTLPSEFEIAERFGVSRITAKRALDELAGVGFVDRARGRGTTVRYEAPASPIRSSLEGWLDYVSIIGLSTEVRMLDFAYVPAAPEVATALGLPEGAVVQRAVRTRLLESAPLCLLVTHVPEAIGRNFSADDLVTAPLPALLERAGITVASATQTISAVPADRAAADALEVDEGSPLLEIRRVVLDQDDSPIEEITALYRPDRYKYPMVLTRVREEATGRWAPDPRFDPEPRAFGRKLRRGAS